MKAIFMFNSNESDQTAASQAQAWLNNTPVAAQAAFEALATMQLLQEVADNAEAVIEAANALPADTALAASLHKLTCTATTRLIEVSRRQIETMRALLKV